MEGLSMTLENLVKVNWIIFDYGLSCVSLKVLGSTKEETILWSEGASDTAPFIHRSNFENINTILELMCAVTGKKFLRFGHSQAKHAEFYRREDLSFSPAVR